MTVVVRPARSDEADVVGALIEEAYRRDGHLEVVGSAGYAELLRDAATRIAEATVLVADLDGAVVGSVTLAPAGTPWANTARPGELEVRMLGVAASARGRGVAEALMGAAEDHARTLGLDQLVLSTNFDMYPAQRLYERLGYQRRPDRDWSLAIPFLVYVKPI